MGNWAQNEEYAPHITGRLTYGVLPDSGSPVKIVEKDGLAILDGDIILGPIESVEISETQYRKMKNSSLLGGNLRFQASRRWLRAEVPYYINPSLNNQSRVFDAISHWETYTPLRFVRWTTERDYVQFNPDSTTTCSSSVGRIGGRQIILLADRCHVMNTVHEIGHAVGFYHEQSRLDRDSYVKILWDAILETALHNFDMFDPVTTRDFGKYDYGSIMHYSASSFPKVPGATTIVAPEPIGQRISLSPLDIETAIYFYTSFPVRVGSPFQARWFVTNLPVSPGQRFEEGTILFRVEDVNGFFEYVYRAPAPGMVSSLKYNTGDIVATGDVVLDVFNV